MPSNSKSRVLFEIQAEIFNLLIKSCSFAPFLVFKKVCFYECITIKRDISRKMDVFSKINPFHFQFKSMTGETDDIQIFKNRCHFHYNIVCRNRKATQNKMNKFILLLGIFIFTFVFFLSIFIGIGAGEVLNIFTISSAIVITVLFIGYCLVKDKEGSGDEN